MTGDIRQASIAGGIEALEPVLEAELRKQKAFDLVFLSRELQLLTGQGVWHADDSLPPDLLKKLGQAAGCDGLLFAHLTVYRPYPPIAVGWKLALVEGSSRFIWWSVDEVFDAGSLPVAKAAQANSRAELNLPEPLLEGSAIVNSPRRFGQYAAHAVVSTLPRR